MDSFIQRRAYKRLNTVSCYTDRHTQISMPRVGFEPTIPAFDRTKIALDRAATVIVSLIHRTINLRACTKLTHAQLCRIAAFSWKSAETYSKRSLIFSTTINNPILNCGSLKARMYFRCLLVDSNSSAEWQVFRGRRRRKRLSLFPSMVCHSFRNDYCSYDSSVVTYANISGTL
jgi:hypothetical protein